MVPWVAARATGLVAYALLAGAMLAGLAVKSRSTAPMKGGEAVDLHRHLSLLALCATGAHGAFLVLDDAVDISPLALVVPGLVPYRPLWTGVGVAAAWLMAAIHVSFRLRKRIGPKRWRRLHYATYAAFAGATLHGLLSGSDSGSPWALALYGGAVAAVFTMTGWRIAGSARPARPPRTGGPPAPPAPAQAGSSRSRR
jgi:DMSO/TMAO reductase YedYZ heme-binding membrane subunit